MADAEEPPDTIPKSRRYWPQRKRFQFLLVLLILLLVSSLLTWRAREDIADDLIVTQLDALGIDATYEIVDIGLTQQILRNFVVGDPDNPDLVIERVEVIPVVGVTGAGIGTLTLVNPKLRATYIDGKFSLGALDAAFKSGSDQPASLPNWSLNLVNARARIATDYGVAGLKADGQGRLDGGFQGITALVAPDWDVGGCNWNSLRLVGELTTSRGQPYFNGPLSLESLSCQEGDIAIAQATISMSLVGNTDLARGSGELELTVPEIAAAGSTLREMDGAIQFDLADGLANMRYQLAAGTAANSYATIDRPRADGGMRYRFEDGRVELDGGLTSDELQMGRSARTSFGTLRTASEGTLAAPLIAQLEQALENNLSDSTMAAEVLVRSNSESMSVVVPSARLRNAEGQSLLALSQVQMSSDGEDGTPLRLAGNFATDGTGMPRIRGRMENDSAGNPAFRIDMAPYRAAGSSVAIPQMLLAQSRGGWSLNGEALASGQIPGGTVRDLRLPIVGEWSDRRGLAMWRRCTDIRFEKLELAELRLERDSLTLCPDGNGAIVQSAASGTQIAARIEGLELEGRLGDSPIQLASGQIGFNAADGLVAEQVNVSLGEEEAISELSIATLTAGFKEGASGSFSGIAGGLDAVPLNIQAGEGEWSFNNGLLQLNNVRFDLLDRSEQERFERLFARDASLTLADNVIAANALMRHPGSDRAIVEVNLTHNLSDAAGFADLDVPGIVFDDKLEPGARIDQCDGNLPRASGPTGLTCLATGVVALAQGVVTGRGRIDWNPDDIVSSGTFQTEDFDFAAAFGPVEDVSGTVHFSDLLSLTTDGTQQLAIGSIDPGVVVFDGTLDFAIIDGSLVSLRGGRWPFFGGTMELRPTELNFAISEERRYVIEVTSVDAAQFIAAMEFSNISASGTFDGTVPLVFDDMGNGQIINGLLISRPPGGNLSYVGELTYEDMGLISNYAFQSLRSLDFNQMMVEMEGPLTGEIITRLLFDGVRQGEDADTNFITRQIAKLPIRFNVNVRASFYELMNDLLKTYDPATNIDPGSLGLVRGEDGRMVRRSLLEDSETTPEETPSDELLIQPQESDSLP
ncbi:MAG: exoprotein [Altererythrobacter sp.]|nr:YdbH domain-containing protein [Altererythrobacter sp.]NNF93956.1 exoprotein [Altererythrobacter sp.]NNK45428.1 exoprotein [Altererythrobacter sp.]